MSQTGNRICCLHGITPLLIALFTIAISLATHEPWLDEAEAPNRIYSHGWNPWSLLWSFRGDGHFPLYHLLLFPIFNVGRAFGLDSFFLVKVFSFLQYSVLAYFTCKWIRFPLSFLFLLSYYVLFEYGTISRVYLLSLLCLLIIFKSIIAEHDVRRPFVFVAYFLFPLTHSLSLAYSASLWVYLVAKRKWAAAVTLTSSALIAVYFLQLDLSRSDPVAHLSFLSTERLSFIEYTHHFSRSFFAAWIPFSTQSSWWNKSLIHEVGGVGSVLVLIIGVLAGLSLIKLYDFNSPLFLACFAGSCITLLLLTIKYPADYFRHTGYAAWPFLCLLALALSSDIKRQSRGDPSSNSQSATSYLKNRYRVVLDHSAVAILAFHAFFGLAAVYKDFRQPFSASVAKLEVLEQMTEFGEAPDIFANPCWSFVPIRVLSNWRYSSRPLWDASGSSCSGTPTELLNVQYPDRFILSTWARSIKGKIAFPHRDLDRLFPGSLEEFLSERSYVCTQVRKFEETQDVVQHLYECNAR